MTADQLKAMGLAENASEDEINARIAVLVSNEAQSDDGAEDETEAEVEKADEESDKDDDGEADKSVAVPEGTVLVDKNQFAEMQNQIKSLVANSAKRDASDKEQRKSLLINNALRQGKFRAKDRKHHENVFDQSESAATTLINALEPNAVPVKEMGGDGDVEDAVDDTYDDAYLTPAERRNIKATYGTKES